MGVYVSTSTRQNLTKMSATENKVAADEQVTKGTKRAAEEAAEDAKKLKGEENGEEEGEEDEDELAEAEEELDEEADHHLSLPGARSATGGPHIFHIVLYFKYLYSQ